MAEPKISPKMKTGIKMCEEILGVKCKAKTFQEAHDFLDENLPKIQGKDVRDYRKPSEKMKNAIAIIQQRTGEEFTGSTLKEASEYINKHYQNVFGKSGGKKK